MGSDGGRAGAICANGRQCGEAAAGRSGANEAGRERAQRWCDDAAERTGIRKTRVVFGGRRTRLPGPVVNVAGGGGKGGEGALGWWSR